MNQVKAVLAAVLLVAPLAIWSVPATAATAHNSQAGAYGPTSNPSARTHRHARAKPAN